MRKSACLLLLSAVLFSISAFADDDVHGKHSHGEQLGTVSFPTSCSPAVHKSFERGVALLHSFWYEEAEKQFTEVAKKDPKCAMAHWGVAMSQYHQLWDRPGEETLKRGAAEIATAKSLAKTDREAAYISALGEFYDVSKKDHPARATAYSNAMEKVYAKYPNDREAGAFYALSLLASNDPKDTSFANRKKAIAVLNPLFAQQPDHPGLAHYIIHASDKPQLAPLALNAARRYAAIAPSSAHAVHMPSHIFARLGLWDEDIKSNLASIAVSRNAATMNMDDGGHELHAMDFLSYAYLQTGQNKAAWQVVEDARGVVSRMKASHHHGRSMDSDEMYNYALAEFPAMYALETRDWKQAASLEAVANTDPLNGTITYWARTIGAARLGNAEDARRNLAEFEKLLNDAKAGKNGYATDDMDIAHDTLLAWVLFSEKKNDEALKTMRSAADRQDAVGKGEVDLPVREMLADMLLEVGRPSDALTEYEKALQTDPNRFNGLYGAAHSAELAKNNDKASRYYSQLLKNCDAKSADRPELERAKTLVAQK